MNRNVLWASVALLLVACTVQDPVTGPEPEASQAVAFDAYLNRGTATKSGTPGELNTTSLAISGFGVFGYYTNDVLYSQAFLPNFMYNEKVYSTDSGTTWKYDIPKYWPNEYGTDAMSQSVDRVSFFAYAPYVEVDPATGLSSDMSKGITKMTRAIDTGDPKVSYIASFDPDECVDLCWGVAIDNPFNDALSSGGGGGANNVAKGTPYLNVAKLTESGKIKFDFKHALAALKVKIDAYVDGTNNTNAVATDTKIYVRQVTFQGFAMQGTLNLNNSTADTPSWVNYDANGIISSAQVTVYDQRRDGSEAIAAAPAELPGGLNPDIVQSAPYSGTPKDGVTNTAVNLFASSGDSPIYVIPNGVGLKVTIVYDVETVDPLIQSVVLADGETHGSVIENVITKTVGTTPGIIMEAGKQYTLKLHLGMNSVKFDVIEVADWTAESGSTDLPSNTNS